MSHYISGTLAQLIETIDTYQGLLANPDYGRVQVRVTDEMVARGADALWREKAWAVSRDEVRIIHLAALPSVADERTEG